MENPNQNGNNNDPNKKGKKNTQLIIMLVVVGFITFMLVALLNQYITSRTNEKITYNEFLSKVESNQVSKVIISGSRINIRLKDNVFMNYYTPWCASYKSTY